MEEPSTRPPRRRAPAAWPAFPGEHGGIGLGRRHQEGDLVDPSKSSPAFSSPATRSKSSCCNSCRPHQRSKHSHQHASKIEYDDVFGGPPKYLSSVRASPKKKTATAVPDYDDIFRVRSPTPTKIPASPAKSKSRTTELPVFDPPEPMCSYRQLLCFLTFGLFDSDGWLGTELQHRFFGGTAPADASHRYDDSSSHDEKPEKLKGTGASDSTEDDGVEIQSKTTTTVPGVRTRGTVTVAARALPGVGRGKPPGHG